MKRFVLVIDMENDAFGDQARLELQRILADLTDRLVETRAEFGPCRDVNGNKVGRWDIIEIPE